MMVSNRPRTGKTHSDQLPPSMFRDLTTTTWFDNCNDTQIRSTSFLRDISAGAIDFVPPQSRAIDFVPPQSGAIDLPQHSPPTEMLLHNQLSSTLSSREEMPQPPIGNNSHDISSSIISSSMTASASSILPDGTAYKLQLAAASTGECVDRGTHLFEVASTEEKRTSLHDITPLEAEKFNRNIISPIFYNSVLPSLGSWVSSPSAACSDILALERRHQQYSTNAPSEPSTLLKAATEQAGDTELNILSQMMPSGTDSCHVVHSPFYSDIVGNGSRFGDEVIRQQQSEHHEVQQQNRLLLQHLQQQQQQTSSLRSRRILTKVKEMWLNAVPEGRQRDIARFIIDKHGNQMPYDRQYWASVYKTGAASLKKSDELISQLGRGVETLRRYIEQIEDASETMKKFLLDQNRNIPADLSDEYLRQWLSGSNAVVIRKLIRDDPDVANVQLPTCLNSTNLQRALQHGGLLIRLPPHSQRNFEFFNLLSPGRGDTRHTGLSIPNEPTESTSEGIDVKKSRTHLALPEGIVEGASKSVPKVCVFQIEAKLELLLFYRGNTTRQKPAGFSFKPSRQDSPPLSLAEARMSIKSPVHLEGDSVYRSLRGRAIALPAAATEDLHERGEEVVLLETISGQLLVLTLRSLPNTGSQVHVVTSCVPGVQPAVENLKNSTTLSQHIPAPGIGNTIKEDGSWKRSPDTACLCRLSDQDRDQDDIISKLPFYDNTSGLRQRHFRISDPIETVLPQCSQQLRKKRCTC